MFWSGSTAATCKAHRAAIRKLVLPMLYLCGKAKSNSNRMLCAEPSLASCLPIQLPRLDMATCQSKSTHSASCEGRYGLACSLMGCCMTRCMVAWVQVYRGGSEGRQPHQDSMGCTGRAPHVLRRFLRLQKQRRLRPHSLRSHARQSGGHLLHLQGMLTKPPST